MRVVVDPGRVDGVLAETYLRLKYRSRRLGQVEWRSIAAPHQLPPEGDWDVWMLEGGRGAGKTRAGSEYVLEHLREAGKSARVGVGAPTIGDARRVCAEGETGLLTVGGGAEFPIYHRTFLEATHAAGGMVQFMGAEDPNRWNGPQWTLLWVDELALWKREESWHQARFGVRLGLQPRIIVTTTLKARRFVKDLRTEPGVVRTHGTMYDNPGVSPQFVKAIERRYGGTRLGRQEIWGEYVEALEGALWQADWIEAARVSDFPELARVVVGVDPAVTSGEASHETGVVVAGLGIDGEYYVLDSPGYVLSPHGWASHVVDLYDAWHADRVVAEVNQGGEMVEATLRQVRRDLSVTVIRASRGKTLRAEPVAALYEQGRVHHVGEHGALEDQMLTFPVANERDDRVDALVYALTELTEGVRGGYAEGGFSDGADYPIGY